MAIFELPWPGSFGTLSINTQGIGLFKQPLGGGHRRLKNRKTLWPAGFWLFDMW